MSWCLGGWRSRTFSHRGTVITEKEIPMVVVSLCCLQIPDELETFGRTSGAVGRSPHSDCGHLSDRPARAPVPHPKGPPHTNSTACVWPLSSRLPLPAPCESRGPVRVRLHDNARRAWTKPSGFLRAQK